MPLARPPEYGRAVADAVYDAMIATLDAPREDRFQVISKHTRDALLIDPAYLGIDRSAEALIIQLTLNKRKAKGVSQQF